MEKYALYAAKNILQIRKSQLDAKLDRDLRNAAKNHAMETEMFDGEDTNADDKEEDIEEEGEENIDLPMADSYSHAVAITRMRWREQDSTDCLESSVLSHLYHSLRIADDASMTNGGICYDLNLLGTGSRNSQDLGVNIGISPGTTDMWKSIHKAALTGEQAGVDNELDNPLTLVIPLTHQPDYQDNSYQQSVRALLLIL